MLPTPGGVRLDESRERAGLRSTTPLSAAISDGASANNPGFGRFPPGCHKRQAASGSKFFNLETGEAAIRR